MPPVRVNRSLSIPEHEIDLTFSPSGGPGGQHANKVSTRVKLAWNVDASESLGPRQRERIKTALRTRIDRTGTLHLSSDRYRSQFRNREDVLERLGTLLAGALTPRKARVATAPTKASQNKRLEAKKRVGAKKRLRAKPLDE